MDKKILLLLFLVSGFAFSQTTVNLQDQCNCEVLSGTAVTSPGTTTPSGADTGDIYVNTNTGVIYFWDGDSWELTSSDDQQLQNFSFNTGTNILSLDIEDGNTVTVDLSSLSSTGTDDQALSLAGNILTLEDGGTVDLTPFLDNTDDQIITAFSIDASNILTLTLENGNTQTVDLSGLVGTDDQTAAEVTYDNTTSGLTATDVQAAIDEINALAGTVALVDNGDGTYDFTDAAGNTTIISDTSISTLVDNLDGTYTYTDETGATQVIDTNASSNPYDNTTSGLTATDVQAAIDEINALAGTVALVDNGDGTYDFTDSAGNTTIISDTSISTLVDNLDGTYTYTDETGATQVIDTNASSNPYDNTTSGLTATDVQAAIDEINALAGTVALVDNGDGTYDFTDSAGNTTIISDTSISTLVDNLDGTYTYTDETGATQVIDTNASSNPYDNTTSGLTATDVQAAIDEINALAGTVALVDNGDGTYDFTDAAGNTTIISDTSISTLVDNLDGTYTYTDETGATQVIDTNASSNPYDNTTSGLTATDVQAAIDEINALAGTVALVDNGDGTYDFTDAAGNTTIISDTSISTLVDNLDGTYTYTDETGATQVIDTNASSNPYDNTTSGLTATDVQAAIDEINALAGTVALVDNGDGTYDFTDAAGNTTIISDTSISTLVDNLDGTYTYTDETGATQVIDTNASSNPYDNTTSGLTATDVQAAIDEINALAGTVALVDNGDGTYDFTDAAGNTTIISDTSISTLVDNLDGTYTYTDETGATQVIDTNASSNPYDNTTSGLTATDVQAAIDEINALAGTVALVDNGDGTYDFTDAAGNTTIISDTSISTLVDNLDGTYTYTDETGATQVIDTNASSNPYDNTTSGLTATDVQAAIDEINALAGTVALVDNGDGTYDFTDAAGNTTIISDTSISTLVDNLDGTYTYTDETGATQVIDTNASSNPYDNTISGLTATDVQAALDELAAGSTDDQDISGSGLAGTNLTIGIENGANEVVDLSSLVQTVIAGTGAITVTDDGFGNYTVNSMDPDEDLTNELTLLGNGAPAVVPANSGVTYVDTVAGQLYIWDGVAWNAVGGSAAPDLDGDPTNELNTAFAVNAGNLEITDNGSTLSVPIASLGTDDQTAAEVTYDNTTSGLTAVDVQAAIDEVAAGSTDDQNVSGSGLAGTNLTIGIENGASEVVDLSSLVGTDDQIANEVNITDAGGNFTSTEVEGALAELAAGSTDDQNISGSGLAGTDLTIAIENGTSEVVDLSSLVGTDDQIANEVNITDAGGNFTSTEVEGALAELAAGSTDDQNISGSGLAGTNLTIGIESGASEIVDLSSLVGTDDQNLSTDSTPGNISIEDGNTLTLNVDDADADATNEYNTAVGMNAGALEVTDAGGTLSTSLISADANNDISSGSDGALYLNVASVTISETITNIADNGDGTFTYTNENGIPQTINKADVTDNADGTYTFDNNDGTPVTISTTAASNPYDNTTSGLTATDVQAAIDEVATGSTDDQNISGSGLAGTDLTIGIENGTSEVVDLSSLVGTDDQIANEVNITDAGGNFTSTEVEGALAELAAGSTDDQNISGSALAGTNLTIAIENGASEVVDLSSLVGTDDQIANEVNITDAGGNFTSTEVEGALAELAAGSTDDQNISGSGLAGTDLTIAIENGASEVVDLSSLVGTDDQTAAEVTYDNTTSGLTAVDVQAAIDEVATGSTDDQNISGSGLAGTNLTIGIENGTAEVVDLSSLVGTDDQDLTGASLSGANILQIDIENGSSTTVDLSSLDDSGTDDQNISGSGLAGTDLTIGIENGTAEVVDLSSLVGTDDQIANEVNITDAGGNFTSTEVEGALAELAAGSTDDQDISGSGLAGTNLTIGIENGASEVVDLSTLVGTDDQNLSTDSSPGNISIEDGNSLILNVDDADADATNEYNTSVGMNAGAYEVTDAGGTLSASLISTDANNDISSGSDGALYLNVSSVTISETITNVADNGDGTFTYTNENGVPQTISKADVTDNADGTYTFDNNDGTPVTISTTAASNPYDNTTSGLTATDVQAAIDEVATGSTDDQNLTGASLSGANVLQIDIENGGSTTVDLSSLDDSGTDDQDISGSGLAGTDLTIGIENGTSEVVDLSSLVGTDDQNLTGASLSGANVLQIDIENGGSTTVDLSSLDNSGTDDQNISGSGLAGTDLTIGIENGTSEVVDLSSLVGTDDQIANEVNITDAGGNFTSTEVEGALAELAAGSTDDQDISGSGLAGTDLTIGIENGTSEVVDLSSLVGTDDQIANEVNITDAGGNFTSTEVEGALAELAAGSTDDQDISGSALAGTNLTIGIENGASEVVDLSSLVGTDDQNLTGASLSGANVLQIDIENGGSTTVDLSSLDDSGTDDQNISGSALAGTDLTIGIENGTSEVVDLSSLVGTDDQIANEVNITDAGGNFTSTEVEGALAELAAGSTDDQDISGSALAGTNLTIGIENGASEVVDLSSLVGSDDQNITGSGLAGTDLTIGIENGTSEVVDLSSLVGTDDQIANEVNITDAGGNFTSTEVEGALAELAAGSTDDQDISGSALAGTDLTIGIENGASEVVDLSSLVGSDDQNITGSGLAGTDLTIGIENGTSEVVDLSSLVGTDDQIANEVNITDAGGNFTSTEVEGALAELAAGSTDDQDISGSALAGTNLTIGIENGASEVVDLSSLVGSDDQNITGSGLAGTDLTIGIENGTSEVVDLSSLVGTDDQNLTGASLSGANVLQIDIENGGSTTVDLSSLDNSGTDDQNISGSGLAGTDLTIGIENGTSEVVDLSSLVGTDDQIANEVNITDAGGNFTSTEVEGALAELAAGSTDDQDISGSALAGTNLTIGIENGASEVVDLSSLVGSDDQNITGSGLAGTDLTIGIENGTSEVVDLSSLVGTDDQIANEVNITDAGGNFTSTEVEGALAELAAGSTDDQDISGSALAGTDLTIGIENGASEVVDLSSLVGSDDQNITGSGLAGTDLTIGIENGTSEVVDLSSLVGTDDQNLTGASLSGANVLQIDIENGGSTTVDLSSLDNSGTDDQDISGSALAGTDLTIGIENGASEVVDLSSLVGSDDQNITGSGLAGTDLTIGIENGTSEVVDLSSLVGTDDQNLTGASLSGANVLQIDIENGGSTTVDLSSLDNSGTDDQTAAEVTYNNTTSGLTAVDVQAAIDEVAAASTDDQYDDEVPLRTPIDVDEGGVGSPTNETTVEEVIQAIAPITSKAARIFYPPSIAVDASTNGSFSIDLYAQYTAQFGTPTVASSGAPAAVPTYGATELYYYVTYADPTVFNTATMAIDANGVLSYEIIGQPSDYNSLINVVFVVK